MKSSIKMNLTGFTLLVGLFSLISGQSQSKYSLQNMPRTSFTCRDKILGGYYADAETQCQMFHICVKVAGVGIQDFRFLCPNGTAFDQEAQICADWGDVDCETATLYYGSDNFDLYRIGSNFESKRAPFAEEDESVFHLQRAETNDARRSKQYIVNQSKQETPAPRPSTTVRTTLPSTTARQTFTTTTTVRQTFPTTTTTNRPTYDQTISQAFVTTFKPTIQPKNHLNEKISASTYRPNNGFFNPTKVSRHNDEEILKQSQSSNFFNNKNNGKEDFDDDFVRSTKAPLKQKVKGRQRGRSKYRAGNTNSVTSAPERNSATIVSSTQKNNQDQQQHRTTFTNAPIVVQPITTNRFEYENFRKNETTTLQGSNNFRSIPNIPTTTVTPVQSSTIGHFDAPKVNQKLNQVKIPIKNNNFIPPTSTVVPPAQSYESFPHLSNFGAIPQRIIIPSKLSKEQRLALQASSGNIFQSTAASYTTPTTTKIPHIVPHFNRISQPQNQAKQDLVQKPLQNDFNSLPQKFNFKTQKYESIEPLNPTTQFYNPNYETKGTDDSSNNNINVEPTRSAFIRHNNKTYAPRQQTTVSQENNSRPTTFNPQQYYQSDQYRNENLSPRGFSVAAQQQQRKTPELEIRPQITSRSESRNHKKFSTLVPKELYSPTTFKPSNTFSKKPVDPLSSQKLEKIQNPNKYYSQFSSTTLLPPTTTTIAIAFPPQQPQLNNFNSNQFQQNIFQTTTRHSSFFSTSTTLKPLSQDEEDDGQYRPELYEKDFYRNRVKTTRITSAPIRNTLNNFYQTSTTHKPQINFNSGEDEFLKTAHSQNIVASGNQLRAEKEREKSLSKFDEYVTTASTEKSSPRPFAKPVQSSSPPPTTTSTVKPKAEKDASYDYQYYDTNAEPADYSEFGAIEDFGKTSKKSSSSH